MSFADQLVLHDAAHVAQTFDLVSMESSKNSTKTVRRDASRALNTPMGLTIAHEVSKDGKTVNSVVFIERTELGADNVTLANARVQLKITYRNDVIEAADVQDLIKKIVEFAIANDTFTYSETNTDKLLNREG